MELGGDQRRRRAPWRALRIRLVDRGTAHASIFKTAPISSLAGVANSTTGTIGSPAATVRLISVGLSIGTILICFTTVKAAPRSANDDASALPRITSSGERRPRIHLASNNWSC